MVNSYARCVPETVSLQKSTSTTRIPRKAQGLGILFAFIFSFVIVYLVVAALCFFYNPVISSDSVRALILDQYTLYVQADPKERSIFIFLVCILPFISLASVKLVTYFMPIRKIYLYGLSVLGASIIILISALIINIFASSIYYACLNLKITSNWRLEALAIIISTCSWIYLQTKSAGKSTILNNRWIFISIIAFCVIATVAFRILSLYTENRGYLYGPPHFGAVFYSVSQVMAGKTLLVNLPAQYGMYSEMLNPLFKIIGLSVLNFTVVMSTLAAIGMVSLFVTLRKVLHSPLLTILGVITLSSFIVYGFYGFSITFAGHKIIEPLIIDPYFQYFPIRFFFPAISVYLFISVLRKNNLQLTTIIAFSVFSTLAVLWNIDSGIPVLGAYLAYLVSLIIFPTARISRIRATKFLGISLSTCLFTAVVFALYILWKAHGRAVHFSWLYEYQRIFTQAGLNKVNMPLQRDPWQIIFAIYILGITTALFVWSQGRRSLVSDTVFYLSILGIGLFSYYEYRAYAICLIFVSWPAIMIAFMFSDSIFRSIRLGTAPRFFSIICYPVILFSLILAIALIHFVPVIYHYELKNWAALQKKQDNFITGNLRFMRSHLNNEKEVAILATEQAIYFGELGVASAIDGAGIFEMLLKSDVNYMDKQLQAGKPKVIFFQKNNSKYNPNVPLLINTEFLKNYQVVAVSPYEMEYLVRKSHT